MTIPFIGMRRLQSSNEILEVVSRDLGMLDLCQNLNIESRLKICVSLYIGRSGVVPSQSPGIGLDTVKQSCSQKRGRFESGRLKILS